MQAGAPLGDPTRNWLSYTASVSDPSSSSQQQQRALINGFGGSSSAKPLTGPSSGARFLDPAGLLPALPLLPANNVKRQATELSPPRTPPHLAAFTLSSTPVRPRSSATQHPWNTPASSVSGSVHAMPSPGRSQASADRRSPAMPDPPAEPPSFYHEAPSLAIGSNGASLSADLLWRTSQHRAGQDVVNAGRTSVPALAETDEEFMRNVQRIVNADDAASEERTPSPLLPDLPPAATMLSDIEDADGESDGGMQIDAPVVGSSQEPTTAKIATPRAAPSIRPFGRLTRSRDAKETEQAIAAVRALEATGTRSDVPRAALDKGKGKAKWTPPDDSIDTGLPNASITNEAHAAPPSSRAGSRARLSASPQAAQAPSTPPRTTKNDVSAAQVGVAITVSPLKGRRLQLVRPQPEPIFPFADADPTAGLPTGNLSDPVMQWLNTPSPEKPAKSAQRSAVQRTSSQVERDWSSIDLGALAITIPPTSNQRNGADSDEVFRVVEQGRLSKKRKRLNAFRHDSSDSSADGEVTGAMSSAGVSTTGSRVSATSFSSRVKLPSRCRSPAQQSPLKAAHVDGLGRMAVHPGDMRGASVVSMAAVEDRSALHRTLFGMSVREERRDGARLAISSERAGSRQDNSPTRSHATSPEHITSAPSGILEQDLNCHGPHWPDSLYPWSSNEGVRRRKHKKSKSERMELVERFLDRESDSDSAEESATATSSVTSPIEDGVVAGARGLWALAQDKTSPSTVPSPIARRLGQLFPSEAGTSGLSHSVFGASPSPLAPPDPGDARVALASRRDVRSSLFLATQCQERPSTAVEEDEDEGEVRCVCQGPDDGGAMVRCNICKTWSHQSCVGVEDESQLGERWYCVRCEKLNTDAERQRTPPSPILVQAEDPPDARDGSTSKGRSFLAPASKGTFASPPTSPAVSLARSSPVRGHPRTPKVRQGRRAVDLAAGVPQTPRNWLDTPFYRTPRFLDDFGSDLASTPLDVLGTPSRGTKYSVAFMPSAAGLAPRPSFSLRDGIFATPKAPSKPRVPTGSGIATMMGAAVGSSASTLHDQAPFISPPPQHYSQSFPYTETPIQRPRPVINGLAPAVSLASPSARRKGKGVEQRRP